MTTTAFIPKDFPRTKLATSGRVLSDAQQHQYDVLRTVGGKLVSNRRGWFRLVDERHERIYGLNTTAMWSLVKMGLVVSADDNTSTIPGYLFLLPDLSKDVPGPRYESIGQIIKAAP
jgi:hypothetical protein